MLEFSVQHLFFVLENVSFQERNQLVLERFHTVMLGLVDDVSDRVLDARHADADGSVALLPFKCLELRKRLVNPS